MNTRKLLGVQGIYNLPVSSTKLLAAGHVALF